MTTVVMLRASLVLVVLASLCSAAHADQPDACAAMIPATLAQALLLNFPKYRLPHATENDPIEVNGDRAEGGNGCLRVGMGNFGGNGNRDFIIGMTPRQGRVPLVVVALAGHNGWVFHVISKKWVDDSRSLCLGKGRPGRYHRNYDILEGPLEAGEKESFDCDQDVVVVGICEASGIAYCYANGKWNYVHFSD
jgi:hypothetical protein